MEFDKRIQEIKENSKTSAKIILESYRNSNSSGMAGIVFDSDNANRSLDFFLHSRGYTAPNIDFNNRKPLADVVDREVLNFSKRIETAVARSANKFISSVGLTINGKSNELADLTSLVLADLEEIEAEIVNDSSLDEQEKLALIASTSVLRELAPGLFHLYEEKYHLALEIAKTKGWFKNLFKAVVNTVVTIVAYVASFTLYGAVIGALSTAGAGTVVGAIVGSIVGAIWGIGCTIDAYTSGPNGCIICTFNSCDWTSDPCYDPNCTWLGRW